MATIDDDDLRESLRSVTDLAEFAHAAIVEAIRRGDASRGNLTDVLAEAGLQAPAGIDLSEVEWSDVSEASTDGLTQQLVVLLPGHPEALGFTVGCIRIRGRRVCLECGWLYCRVVIRW